MLRVSVLALCDVRKERERDPPKKGKGRNTACSLLHHRTTTVWMKQCTSDKLMPFFSCFSGWRACVCRGVCRRRRPAAHARAPKRRIFLAERAGDETSFAILAGSTNLILMWISSYRGSSFRFDLICFCSRRKRRRPPPSRRRRRTCAVLPTPPNTHTPHKHQPPLPATGNLPAAPRCKMRDVGVLRCTPEAFSSDNTNKHQSSSVHSCKPNL